MDEWYLVRSSTGVKSYLAVTRIGDTFYPKTAPMSLCPQPNICFYKRKFNFQKVIHSCIVKIVIRESRGFLYCKHLWIEPFFYVWYLHLSIEGILSTCIITSFWRCFDISNQYITLAFYFLLFNLFYKVSTRKINTSISARGYIISKQVTCHNK